MIYLVLKELKIKKENKEEFSRYIEDWIYRNKQQELNLSIDGYWIANKFFIFERWSSEESFNKFTRLDEYINFINKVESYSLEPLKIKKVKTVN